MKRINSKRGAIILATICAIWLQSCTIDESREEIVIVSTNDIHAAFEQIPRLVTLVDSLRGVHENVLVLDAGDRCTGNPYVDKASPKGEPLYTLLNMVGYDFSTLGNHEFDYGQEGMLHNIKHFGAEELCANADFTGADEEPTISESVSPYKIFDLGGVRTAILGLIQINDMGIPSAMPDNMRGIKFFNGVDLSHDYEFLRDSAELLIALTHLGFEDDSVMVCRNTMFDLVVGGHSHTYLPEGRVINGTLVTQTGSKLRDVGVTRIEMEGGKVLSIKNELVSLSGVKPNAEAAAYIERCKGESPLNTPVGSVDRDLDRVGMINMFTDIMRERSGADIVLQNGGSIRIDDMKAGEVTAATIYELEPFGNHIVTQEIMLSDVKRMIINKFNGSGGESHRIDLSPSGMSYTIVVGEDGEAEEVICYDLQGGEMANRKVTMATSNYVTSAYIYPGQGEAKAIEDGVVIAEAIIDVLKRGESYTGDNEVRVTISKR
ncbi:MAG: bifunctional UDP-sugar hydrolase/5'-nucleotidase [Rikenellaceae bacterium]